MKVLTGKMIDAALRADRERKKREAEFLARQCMVEMCALMAANQWKKKPKEKV